MWYEDCTLPVHTASRARSPPTRRASPPRRRASPVRRRSPSPAAPRGKRRSPSPPARGARRAASPSRSRSRSPVARRGASPARRASPVRRRSRSPVKVCFMHVPASLYIYRVTALCAAPLDRLTIYPASFCPRDHSKQAARRHLPGSHAAVLQAAAAAVVAPLPPERLLLAAQAGAGPRSKRFLLDGIMG